MPRPRLSRKHAQHDQRNLETAGIILDDVEGNGGEEAAIVQWARAVVRKADKETHFDKGLEPDADCNATGAPQHGNA